MKASDMDANISKLREALENVLQQPAVPYSNATPASFPETKGIYVITSDDGEIIRAGKTGRSLRERLYNNHLMGTQSGNLRAQLVGSGHCQNLDAAKAWMRQKCNVRFYPIENDSTRARVEHFMLAVIEPRYCDKNQQD